MNMKWFASVVLVSASAAFMLRSPAASAQAVFGNESDAVGESEPQQASQPFQLSLSPSDDGGYFGPPLQDEDARQVGYEFPTPFGLGAIYADIERDVEVADDRQVTDNGVTDDGVTDDGVTDDGQLTDDGVGSNGGHFSLPQFGVEVRKAGYELPKPIGFGVIFTDIERDIDVTDVRVGINGGRVRSVSDFITLRARSHVQVAMGRFDVWLLPFLNVYGLLGYVNNETRIQGTAKLRGGGGSVPIDVTTKIEGPVAGAGLTLGGGFKEVFATLDVNFTETNLGFDENFRATVATVRAGWNGKVNGVPVRLWTGVTYWDTFETASGTSGSIHFQADQGPANPWNPVFGAHVTLHENFDLFFELGTNFDDVRILTGGLTFRF
jgi:hypothetical protein